MVRSWSYGHLVSYLYMREIIRPRYQSQLLPYIYGRAPFYVSRIYDARQAYVGAGLVCARGFPPATVQIPVQDSSREVVSLECQP
jgi:hypothetical protein